MKHDGELDADELLDSGRAPALQKRPAGYVDKELQAAAAGPYVLVVYVVGAACSGVLWPVPSVVAG